MVEFTTKKKEASESDLKRVEEAIGCSLPQEYREFLKECDGGFLQGNIFPAPEGYREDFEVGEFLSAGDRTEEGLTNLIDSIYSLQIKDNIIPSDFLYIATDHAGNPIVLGVSSSYRGHIYLWDHEDMPLDGEDPYQNIFFLSDNVNDFFNRLERDTEIEKIWEALSDDEIFKGIINTLQQAIQLYKERPRDLFMFKVRVDPELRDYRPAHESFVKELQILMQPITDIWISIKHRGEGFAGYGAELKYEEILVVQQYLIPIEDFLERKIRQDD